MVIKIYDNHKHNKFENQLILDIAHTLKKFCLDKKCWKYFQKDYPGGTNKKTISMHVPYAIVRNVLERIVDMGLMN